MAFDTKAFAAQDALVAALQNTAALAAWTIDYGMPAGRPQEQHIWVDEQVTDWGQELTSTGLTSRSETFRLSVYIYDKRTGATAQEVRDEIRTAAAAIADTLGSDTFLGGVVLYAQIVGGEYEGAFADANGHAREGVLKLTVECSGFLA
jgi:hypothetical protein